ncbi:MAG: ComF family protein [Bacteroidia bacterium]|nr:ComF family protein [Bacteroidia bacterium]
MCRLGLDFIELLYPRLCVGCNHLLSPTEKEICLVCLSHLETCDFEKFPQNNPLYYRLAGKIPLLGACSCFVFTKKSLLQRIIHQAKYHNNPYIMQTLGMFFAQRLLQSNFLANVSEIVPIPLHPKKLKKRGYNQAEYIAKGIAQVTHLPINTYFLYRTKNTETQTRKNKIERWNNVKDAFECKGTPPNLPLLIDDVITSGATTQAAAFEMYKHGCKQIKIASLAFVS